MIGELVGVAGSGKSTVAALLAARTFDVSSHLSWRQHIGTCLKVSAHRLPHVIYHAVHRVPLRFLAIMVNIEVMLQVLARHRESPILRCSQVILDLGPFLQLATLRHAYLAQAPTLASSSWLSELTVQSRQVIDRVFWLDADDRVLMERVSEREQEHAMKGRPPGAFETFFSEYRREFTDLLSGYPASWVKRIDTGAMSAEHVFELIDAQL
jgi:thymidylate kinase